MVPESYILRSGYIFNSTDRVAARDTRSGNTRANTVFTANNAADLQPRYQSNALLG